jgi:homoserine dehydrogenase
MRFSKKRHCTNPLAVHDPGAGPEVAAVDVFADVLRIARASGTRA